MKDDEAFHRQLFDVIFKETAFFNEMRVFYVSSRFQKSFERYLVNHSAFLQMHRKRNDNNRNNV